MPPTTYSSRLSGYGPFFVAGSFLPPSTQIEISDEVVLHLESISVRVLVLAILADGKYSGRVVGFENYVGTEIQGLTYGSQLEFSETNVFGCSKKA